MANLEMLPFEKNRYYYGKMLTVSDFQAEQEYISTKQMFLNHLMLGSGILCGLEVSRIDANTLLLDSGAAIDSAGRSIVVEKRRVKSLDTIKGFDRLLSDKAVLYLSYQEEEIQEVRVTGRSNGQDECEYNRLREKYDLYVADFTEEHGRGLNPKFFRKVIVAEHSDYVVSLSIPRKICRNKRAQLTLWIDKLTDREAVLDFYGILQFPGFLSESGTKELDVRQQEVFLRQGEHYSKSYWLTPDLETPGETEIFLKTDTVRALVGKEICHIWKNLILRVVVTDQSPEMIAQMCVGQKSLDDFAEKNREDVPLAVIYLQTEDEKTLIRRISQEEVAAYIPLPRQEEEKASYLSFYKELSEERVQDLPVEEESDQEETVAWQGESYVRGGTLEIPLDVKMKKGSVCYSEEIVHGLGPGPVYVQVGVQCDDDTAVYGDTALFQRKGMDTNVKTAVKVFQKRGSFQAAVTVMGEQNSIIIPLHWTAVKIPERGKMHTEEYFDMSITPELSTVYLKPKEVYHIKVQFHNMAPCTLKYEITDGDGDISPDGTYTAPGREGVYEIRISSSEYKQICTYVYAVVGERMQG